MRKEREIQEKLLEMSESQNKINNCLKELFKEEFDQLMSENPDLSKINNKEDIEILKTSKDAMLRAQYYANILAWVLDIT